MIEIVIEIVKESEIKSCFDDRIRCKCEDANTYIGRSVERIYPTSRPIWYKDFRIDERSFNEAYNTVEIPEFFSPDLWKGKYNIEGM